ncbi:MAG TPA: hypothetical protein VGM63_03520 [Mucilaginibacter sp.]|jgi:hypothetical protein
MIEKSLVTATGQLKIAMPTQLSELTLGQVMELQQTQYLDDLEAISLLSGVSMDSLTGLTDSNELRLFEKHIESLNNQLKYLYESHVIPKKVYFLLGKRKVSVRVAHHLSVESAEAFLSAGNTIADEINRHISLYGEEKWKIHFVPSLSSCCHLLADYFYCRATGKKYDEFEVLAFCEEIKKLRVTDALPIATHFFKMYPNLLKQKMGFSERLHLFLRKLMISRRIKRSAEL